MMNKDKTQGLEQTKAKENLRCKISESTHSQNYENISLVPHLILALQKHPPTTTTYRNKLEGFCSL